MKEKLIAFGCKKDNEFNTLQADICRLKSECKEKSKSIEKSIVEIQKDDKNVMSSDRVISLEEKITELKRSILEFKTEFSSKFERFKSKFSTYADAMETIKPKDFFSQINNKFNSFKGKFKTYADIVKNKPVEVLTGISSKFDVVWKNYKSTAQRKFNETGKYEKDLLLKVNQMENLQKVFLNGDFKQLTDIIENFNNNLK